MILHRRSHGKHQRTHPADPALLLGDIRALIETARQRAAASVNSELTMLYWRIGQRIHSTVLDRQRAGYGKEILSGLAARLTVEYGNGFPRKACAACSNLLLRFPRRQLSHH